LGQNLLPFELPNLQAPSPPPPKEGESNALKSYSNLWETSHGLTIRHGTGIRSNEYIILFILNLDSLLSCELGHLGKFVG